MRARAGSLPSAASVAAAQTAPMAKRRAATAVGDVGRGAGRQQREVDEPDRRGELEQAIGAVHEQQPQGRAGHGGPEAVQPDAAAQRTVEAAEDRVEARRGQCGARAHQRWKIGRKS